MTVTNETVERAMMFAVQKHAGQQRKGNNTPYFLHPMRVATICYYVKRSENINAIMVKCFLHDTVEDCGVEISEIAELFGHEIAAGVQELTTNRAEMKRLGKAEYLRQKMLKMSSYALIIKLADRLDNIRDMVSLGMERQLKTVAQTKYILEGLKERKLTATHCAIIDLINQEMKKYPQVAVLSKPKAFTCYEDVREKCKVQCANCKAASGE